MKASDFDVLIPAPAPEAGLSTRWATVTQVSPLRVKLDGDTDALAVTPGALVQVAVGDRVLCLLSGRQVIVLGIWGWAIAADVEQLQTDVGTLDGRLDTLETRVGGRATTTKAGQQHEVLEAVTGWSVAEGDGDTSIVTGSPASLRIPSAGVWSICINWVRNLFVGTERTFIEVTWQSGVFHRVPLVDDRVMLTYVGRFTEATTITVNIWSTATATDLTQAFTAEVYKVSV